jgi:hypothetical protein
MTKRKGSRSIVVDGQEYSWYRGSMATEIRNLATNKAVHVLNSSLEKKVIIDQCEYGSDCCPIVTGDATTPSTVAAYIKANSI